MVTSDPGDARSRAIDRLSRKRALGLQAVSFAVITVVLIVIWAASDGGFFWPIFPVIGFALALAGQARGIWGDRAPSEAAIQREMGRDSR